MPLPLSSLTGAPAAAQTLPPPPTSLFPPPQVLFADTLRFFLSLYGHKLPVLAMDISSDGALLASGGGDKNLRLWGLDFGDCHRSLFAHDDALTAVAFVPDTHYVFTAGRCGRPPHLLPLGVSRRFSGDGGFAALSPPPFCLLSLFIGTA